MAVESCFGCISLKRGSIFIGCFTMLISAALFVVSLMALDASASRITGDIHLTEFVVCITVTLSIASIFLLCGVRYERANFIKGWLIVDGALIFYLIERAFHLSDIQNISFLGFICAFLILSFFCYIWSVVDSFYMVLVRKQSSKDIDSEATTPVVNNSKPCNDNVYTELSTEK